MLLKSKILSSIQPSVGKSFHHKDLETKKNKILHEPRVSIIENCAKVESVRDIKIMTSNLNKALNRHQNKEKIEKLIKENQQKVKTDTTKRLDNKIKFHLDKLSSRGISRDSNHKQKRKEKNEKQRQKNSIHNKQAKQRQKQRKQKWLCEKVEEIKSSTVRNLSSKIDIPNTVYIYLARGLNFVAAKKINKEDLEFDAKEFLRKLEWKAFFYEQGAKAQNSKGDIRADMHIPSRSQPPDQNNLLIDSIRSQIMGFISSFEPSNPTSNLTPAEQRGRAWFIKTPSC